MKNTLILQCNEEVILTSHLFLPDIANVWLLPQPIDLILQVNSTGVGMITSSLLPVPTCPWELHL